MSALMPPCPKCGKPMWMWAIEPQDDMPPVPPRMICDTCFPSAGPIDPPACSRCGKPMRRHLGVDAFTKPLELLPGWICDSCYPSGQRPDPMSTVYLSWREAETLFGALRSREHDPWFADATDAEKALLAGVKQKLGDFLSGCVDEVVRLEHARGSEPQWSCDANSVASFVSRSVSRRAPHQDVTINTYVDHTTGMVTTTISGHRTSPNVERIIKAARCALEVVDEE